MTVKVIYDHSLTERMPLVMSDYCIGSITNVGQDYQKGWNIRCIRAISVKFYQTQSSEQAINAMGLEGFSNAMEFCPHDMRETTQQYHSPLSPQPLVYKPTNTLNFSCKIPFP